MIHKKLKVESQQEKMEDLFEDQGPGLQNHTSWAPPGPASNNASGWELIQETLHHGSCAANSANNSWLSQRN